jgi:hypothetical protein
VPRQYAECAAVVAAAVAVFSIAAASPAGAQIVEAPPHDAGPSVVMRCKDCGTIVSIKEVQELRAVSTQATATAAGTGAAAITGVGSPIGLVMNVPLKKTGSENPYVGSVGTRQWQERTANARYEFTVRMDDGSYRAIPRQGVSDFAVNDRVKLTQFEIEHATQ